MAIPSTVTKRAEGNDFIASTGMLLSGVTGFSIRTGFYLTNSGSYGIETTIVDNTSQYPETYNFPSGKKFEISPGQSKFIPFDFTFVGHDWPGSSGPYSGPYRDGKFINTLKLSTKSTFNGSDDASGFIRVYVTGQTSGFASTPIPNDPQGPLTASAPLHPSGFKVYSDYALNGKPNATLQWYHPATGYYLTRYQIEKAENITNSSVATGDWSVLDHFNINYQSFTIPVANSTPSSFIFKRYGTHTGINQLYSAGTVNNRGSNYGEYVEQGLNSTVDYYYRIKSQFIDDDGTVAAESRYVYGYPVASLDAKIDNADVNNGLLSGSDTLPAGGDPSTVIKNTAGGPTAMYINLRPDSNKTHYNLEQIFIDESGVRGLEEGAFYQSSNNYVFTGIHFIVDEDVTIGSSDANYPAIKTGGPIKTTNNTEVDTLLDLKRGSRVIGMGGAGGNSGYSLVVLGPPNNSGNQPSINGNGFTITIESSLPSENGKDGSSAIYISDTNVSKFRIRRDFTASIFGGGGGGGGGDPYFWPKAFLYLDDINLNENYVFISPKYAVEFEGGDSTSIRFGIPDGYRNEGRSRVAVYRNRFSIDYSIRDISGRLSGGVGGGGRGYGISLAGKFLNNNSEGNYSNLISEKNTGNVEKNGVGMEASKSGKTSTGGNGGNFGIGGEMPVNVANKLLYNYPDDYSSLRLGAGGTAGYAIHVIDGNSNYSALNDILYYRDTAVPSNIDGCIAYFTADAQYLYNQYGNQLSPTATYADVARWNSTNNTNIYMEYCSDYSSSYCKYSGNINDTRDQSMMYYFNDNPCIVFDGHYRRVFQVNNIVGDGVLRNNMNGFEIIYFLSPFATDGYTGWGRKPFETLSASDQAGNLTGGSFKTGTTSNTNSVLKGWSLHHWSDAGYNEDKPMFSYNNPSIFYKSDGTTKETAGLAYGNEVNFQDFTNKQSIERAFMYSISASKTGNSIIYKVYNDLSVVKSASFYNTSFSFVNKPLIGCSPAGNHFNHDLRFFGGISDIAIFNRSLLSSERRSIFNYFASTKMRIPIGSIHPVTVNNRNSPYKAGENVIITLNAPLSNSVKDQTFIEQNSIFRFTDPNGGDDIFFYPNIKYNVSNSSFRGKLTKDLPGNSQGVVYPNPSLRNTLSYKTNFAGFNIFPYSNLNP